jgi:hypothetical protein
MVVGLGLSLAFREESWWHPPIPRPCSQVNLCREPELGKEIRRSANQPETWFLRVDEMLMETTNALKLGT